MMRKAIDQDTLEALISTGAMREFRVVRHHSAWALQGGQVSGKHANAR